MPSLTYDLLGTKQALFTFAGVVTIFGVMQLFETELFLKSCTEGSLHSSDLSWGITKSNGIADLLLSVSVALAARYGTPKHQRLLALACTAGSLGQLWMTAWQRAPHSVERTVAVAMWAVPAVWLALSVLIAAPEPVPVAVPVPEALLAPANSDKVEKVE